MNEMDIIRDYARGYEKRLLGMRAVDNRIFSNVISRFQEALSFYNSVINNYVNGSGVYAERAYMFSLLERDFVKRGIEECKQEMSVRGLRGTVSAYKSLGGGDGKVA